MLTDPIVIVSAARTPMGNLLGDLKDVPAYDLGAASVKAVLERAQIDKEQVDEVIMGCVLSAGQGQAPARQAALGAGLSNHIPCTTVNKMCGSAMKAIMQAYDAIAAGSSNIVIAGGMESMTNAPYLLPKARGGYRLGHGQVIDHMFIDGLEDAYDRGTSMGVYAEATATKFNFSREQQDQFAMASLSRAQQAQQQGDFDAEITPVTFSTRKGDVTVSKDENPIKASPDKIPTLRPAFAKDGTVTAANASSISDGAAAVLLMRESKAKELNLNPMAKILAHSSYAQDPAWFTTAPIHACTKVMSKVDWAVDDVDLFEINEAFAVVTMAVMHELDIAHDKVNVHGGACALGHPIGASGARILVTLLHALQQRNAKTGVASLCIGGGEATALAIEMYS